MSDEFLTIDVVDLPPRLSKKTGFLQAIRNLPPGRAIFHEGKSSNRNLGLKSGDHRPGYKLRSRYDRDRKGVWWWWEKLPEFTS